jgi:DNA-binding Xre family transcriptional regulator
VSPKTRHQPSPLDSAIARILDAVMADRRPRVTRADLSRMTGIDASMLSRMLKPEKPMLVDELVVICDALNIDAGEVIDQGRRRATEAPVAAVQPAPHSTPVTESDIAAGATLPLAEPRHRRTSRSSDTMSRRHTT